MQKPSKFDLNIVAIIPARLESSRLPKKVLADISGKTMLEHVYDNAVASDLFDKVLIAADHESIVDLCTSKRMNVCLTSKKHQSGTDRVAEAALSIDADIIINIQADEPFIEKSALVAIVSLLKKDEVNIGTLSKSIKSTEDLLNYNVVKLVKAKTNRVLLFSRQAIPVQRNTPYREWISRADYFHHLGIYGFKKDTLLEITKLEVDILEQSERLEQLRWLSNGYEIFVENVNSDSFGIDTEEDLQKARKRIQG